MDKIKLLLLELNINRTIIVHWVRGHIEIRGNEVAGKLAKKAVVNDRCVNARLTKEEMSSILDKQFKMYWDENWKYSVNATGKGAYLIDIRDSVSQSIPIYKLKCRKFEKIIYRLRIGHVGLKKYLYRIGVSDSAICNNCSAGVEESIDHYILECHAYRRQRQVMLSRLSSINVNVLSLKTLLGGDSEYQNVVLKILRVLIKYIISTNRVNDI